MRIVSKIPLALTLLRALLAPVVLLLAIYFPNRLAFGACLTLAFLSDVFDGIIARRLKIATANLRRLDSIADSLFYLAAAAAAWLLYPSVIEEHWLALIALGALELSRYAVDLAKFGREASYHMWSSKAWGIVLFTGFFALLALGDTGLLIALPIYVGILADVEGLAISFVMTTWQADVPTIFHALRLRTAERT
jgi:phosphatidylglycerophosphate synthase